LKVALFIKVIDIARLALFKRKLRKELLVEPVFIFNRKVLSNLEIEGKAYVSFLALCACHHEIMLGKTDGSYRSFEDTYVRADKIPSGFSSKNKILSAENTETQEPYSSSAF
jgi:hypothetical protein